MHVASTATRSRVTLGSRGHVSSTDEAVLHAGTFLRGVLEKLGIEPEVRRIGTFKSAGDQLLRKDMSDSQREQLTAILEDVTLGFKQTIAEARGKSIEEVRIPGSISLGVLFGLPRACMWPGRQVYQEQRGPM